MMQQNGLKIRKDRTLSLQSTLCFSLSMWMLCINWIILRLYYYIFTIFTYLCPLRVLVCVYCCVISWALHFLAIFTRIPSVLTWMSRGVAVHHHLYLARMTVNSFDKALIRSCSIGSTEGSSAAVQGQPSPPPEERLHWHLGDQPGPKSPRQDSTLVQPGLTFS